MGSDVWLADLSNRLQRLNQNHRRLTQLLYFVCGALLMLSFAPVGGYVLAVILLQPFLFACLTLSPRDAARYGFCFGAGLFLAGTYWLYISIHVFGQAPLWVAIFLMLGLVFVMGLYYWLTAWLICKLAAGRPMPLLLVGPAVWVAVEWLRGWFLSGFPWMSVGYGQIDSPLAGFAPLVGVYGVSAAVLLCATALLTVLHMQGRQRLLTAGLLIALVLGGIGLRQIQWTQPSGAPITTTIVQGGVTQDQKWLPEQFRPTLHLYRDALLANPASALVVWPEVAIPATLDRVQGFVNQLQADLAASGQTLLFGILERDLERQEIFNSVVMLDGSAQQVYRKRHLVPFGETFPVPDFLRNLMRLMSLPHSDMTAGAAEQALLETAAGQKLAVAICYEDAYGAEQLYALPDAAILINVSNDAWFGDSIAPHQHLEIARMRALEAGRSVVRATNTGISGFIGPRGELLGTMPQFTEVSMTGPVMPHQGLTPYARFGNWPVIVAATLIVLGFGVQSRKRARS